MLTAVKSVGYSLVFASNELFNCTEIVLEAINNIHSNKYYYGIDYETLSNYIPIIDLSILKNYQENEKLLIEYNLFEKPETIIFMNVSKIL